MVFIKVIILLSAHLSAVKTPAVLAGVFCYAARSFSILLNTNWLSSLSMIEKILGLWGSEIIPSGAPFKEELHYEALL